MTSFSRLYTTGDNSRLAAPERGAPCRLQGDAGLVVAPEEEGIAVDPDASGGEEGPRLLLVFSQSGQDEFGDAAEGGLDPFSGEGRGVHGEGLGVLPQIGLVGADDDGDGVGAVVETNLLDPPVDAPLRRRIVDRVDDEGPGNVAKVVARDGLELLLPGRVPDVELDPPGNALGVVDAQGVRLEVDPDGGVVLRRASIRCEPRGQRRLADARVSDDGNLKGVIEVSQGDDLTAILCPGVAILFAS